MSGIINHDSYQTPYGLNITDSYIITDGNANTRMTETDYEIRGVANVYYNKTAFDSGNSPIDRIPLRVLLPLSPPMGNVYDAILEHLEVTYPNHTVA